MPNNYHVAMPTTTSTKRRFDSVEQEAFLNLWRTYDRLRAVEDALFGRFDLTPQLYNVLRLLRGAYAEPIATLELASRLVSRAPDITRMLDKLEQRGLIERRRPTDNRRTVLVGVTDAGLELLAALDEPVRAAHERQLGHLTKRDLKELTALLQRARRPHEPESGPWS